MARFRLGIVATNFLLIADRHSIFHEHCAVLAELHSWAVDFPKNGEPVPASRIRYPEARIRPDWFAPELQTGGHADYYESTSILGVLFRDIQLPRIDVERHRAERNSEDEATIINLTNTLDNLSLSVITLQDIVSDKVGGQLRRFVNLTHDDETATIMLDLFSRFATELDHLAYTYSLAIRGTKRLSEEEILIGTIIAKTSQPQMRRDKISGMREATNILIKRVLEELEGDSEASISDWANRAWTAWKISIMKQGTFGAKCFGFVTLRALFDVLNTLDTASEAGF